MNTDTTQVCKKCKTEKPLTAYYKRSGTSYHRICKDCYRGYAKPKSKRIIVLNPPTFYPELLKRIEQLESKLQRKARSYANDPLEADDFYAIMVEGILTHSNPSDSDSRILTRATWAAKEALRRFKAYAALVGDESDMTGDDDDGDWEITVFPTRSAEDEYIEREHVAKIMDVVAELSDEQRLIISMLAIGHNQREIASKLCKSDQTISSAIKNIAAQLTQLGLTPQTAFAM